ncbi:MAG: restriction endonuclease subunit R, partial [bacterium]
LSERPRVADEAYFSGKTILTDKGPVEVTPQMAKQIYKYLLKNDYVNDNDTIADVYHDAVEKSEVAPLPEDLKPYEEQVFQLIESVYSDANLPAIEDDRKSKTNPLNDNFHKKEFKELWTRINKKAVYAVQFDSAELVKKCIDSLNQHLRVAPLRYTVHRGEQKDAIKYDEVKSGNSFEIRESASEYNKKSIHSDVFYDLIGKISGDVYLKRQTVSEILTKIEKPIFSQFKTNPENFISEAIRLINEQKATMIIECLTYNATNEIYDVDIFTDNQANQNFSKAGQPLKRHIYDYVVTDSGKERTFVEELDVSDEVVVYAKLPKGFHIPTPVGSYNPDWAIAFKEGKVKHIYFVAETKGSMSSMQLKEIEQTKIECARRYFKDVLNKKGKDSSVKYDVIDSYDKLMEVVR